MKIHTSQVIKAPAPVAPAHVNFSTAYVVVRGDGKVRIFDTLLVGGATNYMWMELAQHYGGNISSETILIPLDMFSAVRLGLVGVEELELPEGAKALINIIK